MQKQDVILKLQTVIEYLDKYKSSKGTDQGWDAQFKSKYPSLIKFIWPNEES